MLLFVPVYNDPHPLLRGPPSLLGRPWWRRRRHLGTTARTVNPSTRKTSVRKRQAGSGLSLSWCRQNRARETIAGVHGCDSPDWQACAVGKRLGRRTFQGNERRLRGRPPGPPLSSHRRATQGSCEASHPRFGRAWEAAQGFPDASDPTDQSRACWDPSATHPPLNDPGARHRLSQSASSSTADRVRS